MSLIAFRVQIERHFMITSFFAGFSYVFKGFSLITKKGVRSYVLIPLLINIAVFSVAIYIGFSQFSGWLEHLLASISWLPDWLEVAIQWLMMPLFSLLILVAVYYSFTIVANLIAAPFNSQLALRAEGQLLGKDVVAIEDQSTMMVLTKRTVASELKKMSHMIKWLIVLLILTVIPVVNIIAPFAWLIYSAWMLAIEYADYPMGNHNLMFKEGVQHLKRQRFASLGMGAGLMLIAAIPVVNFLAMPVGVAAGTTLWVKRLS